MIELPKDNDEQELKLFNLIASGEAILIVGAGSSKIIGYPLWGELIQLLEDEVKRVSEDSGVEFNFRLESTYEDDLKYSSRIKEVLGVPRYGALMHKIFESKGCHDSHVKLMELPFRGILTTNYDTTLEDALFKVNNRPDNCLVIHDSSANREINKFFKALNYGFTEDKKIAHLHGIYKQPTSLVLCINDYIAKYNPGDPAKSNWTLHKRIVWALMATRRIVYIGFSMTDPFFQMMHSIASDDFGQFWSDTHFMIARFSTDDEKEEYTLEQLKFADRIKRKFGIQTIFYEDDKSYGGLIKFINKMNHEIVQFKNPELVSEANYIKEELSEVVKEDSSVNEKLKNKLQKKIDELKGI